MIKCKTKQAIDVSDWDSLVATTYGKPYSFQQQDDCRERGNFNLTVPTAWNDDYENDSVPDVINGEEMGVSFAAWLARDVNEWNGKDQGGSGISIFWERNWYPDVQMVANDLHSKGLIPAGDYVIEIDW